MNQHDNELNDGDRELPSVNAKKPTNPMAKKLAIVALCLMVGYLVYSLNTGVDKKAAAAEKKQEDIAKKNTVSGALPPLKLPVDPPTLAGDERAPAAPPAPTQGNTQGANVPSTLPAPSAPTAPPEPQAKTNAGGKKEKTPEELMRDRRRTAPLAMTFEHSPPSAGTTTRPYQQPMNLDDAAQRGSFDQSGGNSAQSRIGAGATGGGSGDLAKSLTPVEIKGTVASKVFDRNYLIPRGVFLDCALETRIDSSAPGMTSCILTKNVYSDNGNLILLDRGSKITGQYQAGIKQGQARIFVLWTRVETPTGIVINIDSPGTDPLGASGHDGYVDTHFWQRFGGAIMLSMIEDGFGYLASKDRERDANQTNISFGNSQDATESMAKESLKNTINIPPTLHKNHGDHINIFVARDLDFRTVYAIAAE